MESGNKPSQRGYTLGYGAICYIIHSCLRILDKGYSLKTPLKKGKMR